MQPISLILLLFFLTTALSLVAARVRIPYPTAMVIAGLLIGVVDYFLPEGKQFNVPLSPNVLFTLMLPPLLYAAAWTTSWRDFRMNLRPIMLLAIGCVMFTTLGIGLVTKWLMPEISWPVAFAFGAIVSPPDAVAATAVTERLRVPKRIVTILDGESLVNDASALVALQLAVAAILGATFSKMDFAVQVPLVAGGGIAIGLALAWVFHQVHQRLEEPIIETAITLLAPYACYILAEHVHVSGVLAVITCGVVLSRHSNHLFSSRTRLNAIAFWNFLTFMLNGLVFILIGLQLPTILRGLQVSLSMAIIDSVIVWLAVIALRLMWVFPAAYLPRMIPAVRRKDPMPPARHLFLIGWIGMRGVVSLAAALALPEATSDGTPLPGRDMVLFMTFSVILATLVVQSLTLSAIIRLLKVEVPENTHCEESEARRRALQAALNALEGQAEGHAVGSLRQLYMHRLEHLAACEEEADRPDVEEVMLREIFKAQRVTLVEMRDKGEIPDELLRKLEHELDLEESRLPG